ncbi:MAG: hypothetical protein H7062_03320 [Candidatus Saccharimonas sp.]|nr:hypothetical protein [Planctomycetaceae bacterium]
MPEDKRAVMTSEEFHVRFDKLLQARNHVLERSFRPDPTKREDLKVAEIRDQFAHVALANRWKYARSGAPIELFMNVVHSPEFNAQADREGTSYFAFICEPVFPRLMRLAIGLVRSKAMQENLLGGRLWIAARLFSNPGDTDELKMLAAASVIWRMALEFLLYHELQHILVGHVGFTRERLGLHALPELYSVMGIDQQTLWCMEYSADLFSALTVADDVLTRQFAVTGGQSFATDTEVDRSLLFLTAVGVAMVLCEFEARDNSGADVEGRTHPPVWTRYVTVIDAMTRRFDERGGPHAEWWEQIEVLSRSSLQEAGLYTGRMSRILADATSERAVDEARAQMAALAERTIQLQSEWSDFAINLDQSDASTVGP